MSSFIPLAKTSMASNKEKQWSYALRGAKTLFFLANMVVSLLLVSAPPLLVVILDLLIPSSLLAAANFTELSRPPFLPSQLRTFRFQHSLLDLPIISITRSLLILFSYLFCNGLGPYFGVTSFCCIASVGYVSMKAIMMVGLEPLLGQPRLLLFGTKEGLAIEVLFLSSMTLAMAHVVAAYKISCREKRKLLVFKFDIEAVSVYNTEYLNYHKIAISK